MNEVRLLGPDGIRARIEELRSRMRAAFPESGAPTPLRGSPSPLSGSIGDLGAMRPFDPTGAGAQWNPEKAKLLPLIESAANEYNLDPAPLDAIVGAESGYDVNARSRAGALGLTQLMPSTATSLGVSDPFDAKQNLFGGARYLDLMLTRFNGDLPLALAAYNAGPGAVDKHGGIPPYPETQAYVNKVLELYRHRKQGP